MTATLPQLIEQRSHLWRQLARPGSHLWGAEDKEAEAAEITFEIERRFPRYAAQQRRLAAYAIERNRLLKAGESPKAADAILDLPLEQFLSEQPVMEAAE